MLAYMHTIISAAENNTGTGWKLYDEQFHLKISQHPEMSLSTVDNHLWVMCITQQQNEYAPNKEYTQFNRPPFQRVGAVSYTPEVGVGEGAWATTLPHQQQPLGEKHAIISTRAPAP
jgi:hypothetical protein